LEEKQRQAKLEQDRKEAEVWQSHKTACFTVRLLPLFLSSLLTDDIYSSFFLSSFEETARATRARAAGEG
jgi:hypothetical protein